MKEPEAAVYLLILCVLAILFAWASFRKTPVGMV